VQISKGYVDSDSLKLFVHPVNIRTSITKPVEMQTDQTVGAENEKHGLKSRN